MRQEQSYHKSKEVTENASIDIITKTVLVYPEINADYILLVVAQCSFKNREL